MSAIRYLVDTNVLLRFLLGEPAQQAASARALFARAAEGEVMLEVSLLIVAETYYTLNSYYGVERSEAAAKLLMLLEQRGIRLRDGKLIFSTLERLQSTNVGFADACLAAEAAEVNVMVASFDRDFDKFKDVKRFDPASARITGG